MKDAVILTFAVVLPMTFRPFSFKSEGALTQELVSETIGPTTLLAFYLGAAPLPLIGELLLQSIASILGMLQAVAQTREELHPVKRLCDWLLAFVGVFLIAWATIALISSRPTGTSYPANARLPD